MEGRDMKRLSILATLGLAVLVLPSPAARADSDDKGSLSASFETNTTYYFNDEGTGATAPDGRFGSNNYLKLDYAKGGFTAGVQLEGYLPAVSGYFSGTLAAENFLSYDIYAGFAANGWDIRVGSLYEQFGSGLLFRTYEDRELGINNALQGVRVAYTFGDYLSVRGLYGRVRNVREYSDAMVSGADLSFSLSRLLDMEKFDIVLEGSVIDKYEAQPSARLRRLPAQGRIYGQTQRSRLLQQPQQRAQQGHTGGPELYRQRFRRPGDLPQTRQPLLPGNTQRVRNVHLHQLRAGAHPAAHLHARHAQPLQRP